MFNFTTILLIVSLASSGVGFFGIKGCVKERDAKIAAREEIKRLQALNQHILKAVEDQKEVRERYEQEKGRLDGLSGADLDAEWDSMFPGSAPGGAVKPQKTGPK